MSNYERLNLLFDMETGDPDDVMTLCFLTSHPQVHLRAVTVTPGTYEQIGLVREVLQRCGRTDIPVGSHRPAHPKQCVSQFHDDWIGKFAPAEPDDLGHRVIAATVRAHPDLTVLTGAPLKNFASLDPDLRIARWVAQGGFAGDNVVPPAYRLPKFSGMVTCPTYNFNGAPKVAKHLLATDRIGQRWLISKNVCHGMVYDAAFHRRMEPVKAANPGMQLIYDGMAKYLRRRPEGKKFHDPLAACAAIDPDIIEFREVEVYRERGKWGSRLQSGTHTFISVTADRERFFKVFTTV
ncbi:MAG: nucleoside hydrolase [Bacteroidota bacterium]